jgi:hypothetical protein
VADEKHSQSLGERIYIAVTAAKECFLGVGVAHSADETGLTEAYGEFQQEALALNRDYCPDTVNTDGWDATQQAWKALFPGITLMLCFLHTVLGIQQHCRRDKVLYKPVTDKLWGLFHALNPRQFGQRLRRLQEWASTHVAHEIVLKKLVALKTKATQFKQTFEAPGAYRTSNQVDRLINYQDRILYQMQYFHGSDDSTRMALRAMALLWNFHPYCQKIQADCAFTCSPFRDLNDFNYHNHWLKNLLIASSLNGRGMGKFLEHKLI